MSAILTLAIKDLRVLFRDRTALFFMFVFPLIYAVFFGAVFSGMSGDKPASRISVAVADEDQSEESRKFVALLEGGDELQIASVPRGEGEQSVRAGRRSAIVVIPSGFGEARRRLFYGEPPRLLLGTDPSRRAEAGMLTGILTKYMAQGMQDAFRDPQKMRQQSHDAIAQLNDEQMNPALRGVLTTFFQQLDTFMEQLTAVSEQSTGDSENGGFRGFEPVQIEAIDVVTTRKHTGPKNTFAISFPQGIVWGVMGCAAGFGISLVSERQRGTLSRLKLAPIGETQILGGKALACFSTTLAVSTMLVLFAMLVFGVRPNSILLLAAALFSISIAFVGMMMLLAVCGTSEQSAAGIGWAVLTILAMIGGGMVPLFVMPAWMQQISSISPIKWAILAMEGPLWRDFSAEMMLLPCGILVGVGVSCFAIGVRLFRWLERT